jgi:hypothetical protein
VRLCVETRPFLYSGKSCRDANHLALGSRPVDHQVELRAVALGDDETTN